MATTTAVLDPVTARYLELTEDKTEWTMPQIARELDVKPQTVRSWRKDSLGALRMNPAAPPHPHHLPKEDLAPHDRPIWYAGTIRKWAMQTGRMDEMGRPQRLKPPGRPRGGGVPLAA
jgi:hypothetical protein